MTDSRRWWHLVMMLVAALAVAAVMVAQEPAAQAAPKKQAPTVKEPESGILFPTWMDVPGAARHQLLGLGCREKTILYVNVYGMGMYAEAKGLGKKLKAHAQSLEFKKAHKDAKLVELLLSGEFEISMRWVFCRDVEGEDVREAFEDWLAPRRKKEVAKIEDAAARRAEDAASLKAMNAFRDLFSMDIEKGDELIFLWAPGGELTTWLNGEEIGKIVNETVARAMWDCYVGKDAAEPGAKKKFLQGAWRLARRYTPAAEEKAEAKTP